MATHPPALSVAAIGVMSVGVRFGQRKDSRSARQPVRHLIPGHFAARGAMNDLARYPVDGAAQQVQLHRRF